jgi:hypothetical protein
LKFVRFINAQLKGRLEKCIDCKEFPCKTFLEWYSKRVGFFKSSLARIGSLFLRKKLGERKWKKTLEKYENPNSNS